jgi:hypothetical protein
MGAAPAARRTRSASFALVVFALLVVATVGAFFVTQRLKRAGPVVKGIDTPAIVSPNGDGRLDTALVGFRLPKPDHVTVAIVNSNGDEVKRLVDDRPLARGRHRFLWTGRDNSGAVPPDGQYFLRVLLRDQGRATTAPQGIELITTPPRPQLVSVTPSRIPPGGQRQVTIRFRGPSRPAPVFSVYRTDGPGAPKLVARFPGAVGSQTGRWVGTESGGRRAGPGTYAFAVTVQNPGLVAGSSPSRLPPSAGSAPRGTGVTVTGPQAAAPLAPVPAGAAARVRVFGVSGQLRWSIERLGAARPLRSGTAHAPAVRIAIPPRATTGLYVVRLRTAAGPATAPLAVRGRGSGSVLVVLPAIAWQGLNPVDDDADGFPDTLGNAQSVALGRPLAFGRLPNALARETAPLVEFLDAHHLGYDLTTDVALARGEGPGVAGHRGVLFAGSELWLTEALDRRLRSYVEGGGHVASFGTDAFRRTVQLAGGRLSAPSPRQQANVFGEQTAMTSSAAAPLVVSTDSLGLFGGSDGYVGLFTHFEQQRALVGGAKVLAGAGRDPGHPAFVAYRLGKGLVVRSGTPEWPGALAGDSEVQAITRSTWDLLSR